MLKNRNECKETVLIRFENTDLSIAENILSISTKKFNEVELYELEKIKKLVNNWMKTKENNSKVKLDKEVIEYFQETSEYKWFVKETIINTKKIINDTINHLSENSEKIFSKISSYEKMDAKFDFYEIVKELNSEDYTIEFQRRKGSLTLIVYIFKENISSLISCIIGNIFRKAIINSVDKNETLASQVNLDENSREELKKEINSFFRKFPNMIEHVERIMSFIDNGTEGLKICKATQKIKGIISFPSKLLCKKLFK